MESKEAICAALRQLVLAQPFESISIQGVCDKAGLSRKTFSRNFSDLEDVVRYQVYLDLVKPMRGLFEIMCNVAYGVSLSYERNLALIKQNADYYTRICAQFGSAWLSEQLAQLTLAEDFNPYEHHELSDLELSFVENYFAHAAAEAFRWWIDGGMVVPEKEVAGLIEKWLYARLDLEGTRSRG